MARSTGPAGVSVSSKLLAVLACFDVERPTLTLSEIAEAAGLPLSTARRLIMELTVWGGLERLPSGRYRVGTRLWEIGSSAPRQRDLREAALPYMQDLYEAAQENVQLIVLDGLQALCVDKIYGKRAVPTETDVGGRMPLHATGAGKALLAFSAPDLLHRAIEAGLTRCTPHTLVEPGRLAASLEKARETGLAYSKEEKVLGAVSVASPLIDRDRQLLGAVAIVAKVGTRMDRLGLAVRTAALSISRVIG
ncbi:MAG: helix-turn-helix domain-containing protein [Propionibacteriales bacterium]|nr:helix-turn-helix domain-containing protein [Propionibacteriales bacterium]